MPITGVFFIPSNPNAATALATVTERLHTVLANEPINLGQWGLNHKLMRDTPSCLPPSAGQRSLNPRYMQFLSLAYHPNHGFIYTSQPPEKTPHAPGGVASAGANPQQLSQPGTGSTSPMVMTTVPIPSCNSLFQHFSYACQPFWCHRHTVMVNGIVYDVGDFRVRIGDVRQTQPAVRVRGTVVEVEWRGPSLVADIVSLARSKREEIARVGSIYLPPPPLAGGGIGNDGKDDDNDLGIDIAFTDDLEESDIDAEYAVTATLIREFWARLGIEGAREAILVPDVGKEVKERLRELKNRGKKDSSRLADEEVTGQQPDEDPDPDAGVDVARQYMEIFRFNR